MGDLLTRMERCLLLATAEHPHTPPAAATRHTHAPPASYPLSSRPPASPNWPWRRRASSPSPSHETASIHDDETREVEGETRGAVLGGAALGEFALHVHSYLLLLDFTSPARSAKASDAIHHELQDLLRHGQLSVAQQEALLRSVKERQAALTKTLR